MAVKVTVGAAGGGGRRQGGRGATGPGGRKRGRGGKPPAPPNAGPGRADKRSSKCKSVNSKSESTKTASPETKDWLNRNTPPQFHNGTLGFKGGGGFLRGGSTTTWLQPGTTIVRYYGDIVTKSGAIRAGARLDGAWWSPAPLRDPIRGNALPPQNSARKMATAKVVKRTEVLTGPGAPRCSNKPGGPQQYCFALGPGGRGPAAQGVIRITSHGC